MRERVCPKRAPLGSDGEGKPRAASASPWESQERSSLVRSCAARKRVGVAGTIEATDPLPAPLELLHAGQEVSSMNQLTSRSGPHPRRYPLDHQSPGTGRIDLRPGHIDS